MRSWEAGRYGLRLHAPPQDAEQDEGGEREGGREEEEGRGEGEGRERGGRDGLGREKMDGYINVKSCILEVENTRVLKIQPRPF